MMLESFWTMAQRIARAEDIHELRSALMTTLKGIRFEAAYFLAPVVVDPKQARVLTNIGLPSEWEELYRGGLKLDDPLPGVALTRQSAFFWPDGLEGVELTPAQRAYMERLAEFGMAHGIAVPCFGPFARNGFVGVTRPVDGRRFDKEDRLKVEVAGRLSFQRYVKFAQPYAESAPSLSPRETEVLHWIAQGKSNAVIADIIGISTSTVDVYVARLFEKMNVTDRTTAAVRALAMGLIISGDYPSEPR